MNKKFCHRKYQSRFHRFIIIQLTVFLFIFLSPAFGVHVHHKSESIGSASVIHSYFWEDHENNHPPVSSPPESLPEHLSSFGLAESSGSWDMGSQVVLSNFTSALDSIFLYYNLIAIINPISNQLSFATRYYFKKSSLTSHRTTKHYSFYRFFLPPPNRSVS